ncbi:CorA family divalent cation transporter [Mogibacterium pumilum]|uniref:Magnesium transporter n=1 Tax=Mogibacterium pumilum TaxID=86332 RepID=A0A223ATB5_9FIRM|nr:CorA family divalent cation transporter [Mogibacterium pumilum]ASS38213.1 hypothetical protein AXF17_07225 [Mogibacterium pumilum]
MIRVISLIEEKRNFIESLDKRSLEKIKALREYVFRGSSGELILGFRTEDDNMAIVVTTQSECVLVTEDKKLIECSKKVNYEDPSDELLSLMLEYSSDDIYELEELESSIVNMEEELFGGKRPDKTGIKQIVVRRKEIMFKKQYYERMELLTDDLAEIDKMFVYLDKRFDKLYSFILRVQEYLNHVSEMYQAQIDIEQNNLMKLFTVITSIFAPLTLITGWYGMNLKLPEFQWRFGYIYVSVLSVSVIIGLVYWFKRKKIL